MTTPAYTTNTAVFDGKSSTILSLTGDMMTGKYLRHRFYEEDLLAAIRKLQRAGTYIDVGANIGNHTIFFAEHCPSTRVIAVEPRSDVYDVLRLNIASTPRAAAIMPVRLAAGRAAGTGSIVQVHANNAGSSAIRADVDGAETVDVRPLDEIVTATDVAVIKIDVEGFECEVLDGAARLLAGKPVLAIECQTPQNLQDVAARLVPMGYRQTGKYCATPTYIFEP